MYGKKKKIRRVEAKESQIREFEDGIVAFWKWNLGIQNWTLFGGFMWSRLFENSIKELRKHKQ